MSTTTIASPLPGFFAPAAVKPRRQRIGVLEFALWAYVALLPTQIEIVVDFRLAPSDFFLFFAVLLGGVSLRYVAPAWSVWQLMLPVVLGMGALVGVFTRGELSRYVVVNKCVGLGVLFLFYMLMTTVVRSWLDLRRILRVLVISVTLLNLASLIAFLSGRIVGIAVPWLNGNPYRLSGMLVDANAYGGLLVLTLAVNEIASSGEAPLLKSFVKNFASLTLLVGIVCTFSRSAWISLVTVWIACWMVKRTVAVRLTVAGLAAALITPLFGNNVMEYAHHMASRPSQVAQRLDLMSTAVTYISQHPFTGLGTGGFVEREGIVIHNTCFWFLTDFGVLGLFVLAGFLAWFFQKGVHAYRHAPLAEQPVVLSLVVGHVAMFALSMGIEAFYTRPWWLVMGLIASSYCILAAENTREPRKMMARTSAVPGRTIS